MYHINDYDYDLPEDLIAQHPLSQRDQSRLLHLDRGDGGWTHRRFGDLVQLLNPGDVLVLNNTKVIPGRFLGRKESGGKVEVLILDYAQGLVEGTFHCLVKASKRPRAGSRLIVGQGLGARVLSADDQGVVLKFENKADLEQQLETQGHVPLPPYIRRSDSAGDRHSYQTVYAADKGAIAAPTAGLHFTHSLLKTLAEKGVDLVFLTLHVGYGTFLPVRVNDIRDHRMHAEAFTLTADAAALVNRAKDRGHRIVAVGTTCVRTLEYCSEAHRRLTCDRTPEYGNEAHGRLTDRSGWCDLFIFPGYDFKIVDAMVTNFHLPKSTLMMLVSAFAGRERILAAYAEAVRQRYRFFSYGDAMFIG